MHFQNVLNVVSDTPLVGIYYKQTGLHAFKMYRARKLNVN